MTNDVPVLEHAAIRKICKVIADYRSNSELSENLEDIGLNYVPETNKRTDLFNALTKNHSESQSTDYLFKLTENILDPGAWRTPEKQSSWNNFRNELNNAMATQELQINEAGKITRLHKAAETHEDIDLLTEGLIIKLKSRGVHPELLKYCDKEIISKSLFHATFEAAKSIPARIKEMTGLETDGNKLFDECFKIDNPIIKINSLDSPSKESEQKGFKSILSGIFGYFRNPRAHTTRYDSTQDKSDYLNINEQDFLDAFSMFSYIHRVLDHSQVVAPDNTNTST